MSDLFLISNFCRVLYVVCFLLGNSPAFRRRGITQKKTYNMSEFSSQFRISEFCKHVILAAFVTRVGVVLSISGCEL